MSTTIACERCGEPLRYRGRGRPPKRCRACKRTVLAAKQREDLTREDVDGRLDELLALERLA